MAPDEIEWFKLDREDDAGQGADQRTQVELDLARTADLVVTVGPRLHQRYLTELHPLGGLEPLRFDPGFVATGDDATAVPPGAPWRILVMGRAEDDLLKGLDLAAKAVGTAARRQGSSARLELVIRGAKEEACEGLRSRLIGWSENPSLDVVVKPFTTSAESLDDDMRRASLVLMPSRTEGFGLVGLEAIAAGVPVLVSSESGLGDLLREILTLKSVAGSSSRLRKI
jgi:glycosyltransferase involved in cell wall biosynthesis